jgi:hypothetical protein
VPFNLHVVLVYVVSTEIGECLNTYVWFNLCCYCLLFVCNASMAVCRSVSVWIFVLYDRVRCVCGGDVAVVVYNTTWLCDDIVGWELGDYGQAALTPGYFVMISSYRNDGCFLW